MKSISGPLLTHFGLDCTTLAVLWKLTRQDGTVMGFTTHDQNIVYPILTGSPPVPGVTYVADTGMTNTATASKSDMSVDNLEVTAFLDSDSIHEADIRAGLYDYATIEIRIVNWADLTMGDLKIRSGTVGQIKMMNGVFTAEVRGLTQSLTTVFGDLYGPLCRAELGSGLNGIDMNSHYLCHVDITLYRQTGTVTSSADAFTILPNSGLLMIGSATPTNPAPAGWFNDGFLQFTSGPMNNFKVEIKNWDGTTLTMFLPLQYQPLTGNTFIIEPGCDKTRETCFAKFNNIINHRGEPDIPGNDLVLLYPNAK
jgi:uncharacterized phage protein (TIGR02218 family)